MRSLFYTIGSAISLFALSPLAFAADTDDLSPYRNGSSCGFFGDNGFGMMNGGLGMGGFNAGWGYGFLGLLVNLIFWIALVAATVYIARKVWDSSGEKKGKE